MPAPHTPLLGRLAGYFTEVITTDALRLLLDDPPSRAAFLDLVGDAVGVDLSMVRSFERERGIEGGWRLDLEGLDAEGRPRLIVEAKIGHLITLDQMRTYLAHQQQALGGERGVLMLLVPATRVSEGRMVLDTLEPDLPQTIRTVVLSWEECLQTMAEALDTAGSGPVSPAADVAQLQAVCRVLSGWVVPAVAVTDPKHGQHLRTMLDRLTERLKSDLAWTGPLVNRNPAHVYRYVSVGHVDNYLSIGLAIGLEDLGGSPFWLCIPQASPQFESWRKTLRLSAYGEELREMGEAVWLPLHLAPDLAGDTLVEHLAAQALVVLTLLEQTTATDA